VERGSRASFEIQSWRLPGWTKTNNETFHVKIASVVRDQTRTSTLLTEVWSVRARLKRDGTSAETRFGISAKRKSPFKLGGGVSSVDYWQPRCARQR